MKKGKLIVISGTDCSGKETQTKLLIEKLKEEGYKVDTMSFPRYGTPTGNIVGGPCLGKKNISASYFEEFAEVPAKVACHYYAADRLASKDDIEAMLEVNDFVILDRYVSANMGHQGGKIYDSLERKAMYEWIDKLEYGLNELPKPDITIFLYMPKKYADILKSKREEVADDVEANDKYLINSEKAYLELYKMYNWDKVDCVFEDTILTPLEISKEVYKNIVKEEL